MCVWVCVSRSLQRKQHEGAQTHTHRTELSGECLCVCFSLSYSINMLLYDSIGNGKVSGVDGTQLEEGVGFLLLTSSNAVLGVLHDLVEAGFNYLLVLSRGCGFSQCPMRLPIRERTHCVCVVSIRRIVFERARYRGTHHPTTTRPGVRESRAAITRTTNHPETAKGLVGAVSFKLNPFTGERQNNALLRSCSGDGGEQFGAVWCAAARIVSHTIG